MIDLQDYDQDKAILLGLVFTREYGSEEQAESSLDELEELCESCGIEVLGKAIQRREAPDPATCAGKGKILELAELARGMGANCLILNTQLSGSQMSEISDLSGLKVLDRTLVILDIFARRATSSEGVLQVEIAQLKDRASRLAGSGKALSRLGGGIGTRGPGESKLESDRRHIQSRISRLSQKLKEVSARREMARKKRNNLDALVFAVCGYTNAGKSSLMNLLCESDLYTMDQVFATLDPNVRRLPWQGPDLLLVDTVGFIRELPHELVEAFQSTLDEIRYADFVIQVTDLSDPDFYAQAELVDQMLIRLEAQNKPRLHFMNKSDRVPEDIKNFRFYREREDADIIEIVGSVRSGEGIELLKESLIQIASREVFDCQVLIPYKHGEIVHEIRQRAFVENIDYQTEGIFVSCRMPKKYRRIIEELPVQLFRKGEIHEDS